MLGTPCPLRRAPFLRASAELQNQECLGCGTPFGGDSSSSLARRLGLRVFSLLKPQWKLGEVGLCIMSATCSQNRFLL